MSQLTLTQMVAKVLVNLRENADPALATPYSQMVGERINQAKQKVEDAHSWKTLATSLTFSTVTSQVGYKLDGTSSSPTVTSSAANGTITGAFPSDERAQVLRDELGNWQVFDMTTASSGDSIRLRRETREREFGLNTYLANQAPVQPNGFSYFIEGGTPFFNLV